MIKYNNFLSHYNRVCVGIYYKKNVCMNVDCHNNFSKVKNCCAYEWNIKKLII